MPTSASLLKLLRQTHLYIGVFISPALLFFAFTGALQTLSLHEGSQGSSYKTPTWIATLAQIHKNQTDIIRKRPSTPKPTSPDDATKPHKQQPSPEAAAPAPPTQPLPTLPTDKWHQHLPLKLFFLLVTLGLFTSTLTGLYMAWKYNRSKLAVITLFLAGIFIPLILLKF
ncbi:MAG: PepSY domain-containing protein [Acidobacteriota bacterium]